jgi:TolB-like protein/Flp pilus assembly protein TadD
LFETTAQATSFAINAMAGFGTWFLFQLAERKGGKYNPHTSLRSISMAGATQHVPSESQQASAADRLDSWKEIAAYLRRSVRTVHRWESEQGLPVHRHLHQSSGTVYAFKSELDEWWASRKVELEAAVETAEEPPAAAIPFRPGIGLIRWLIVAGVVVSAAALGSIAYWRSHVAANVPTIRSLAVLPLQNLTGDPAQEYFADGMTDALITQLAQVGELRVISRTSVVRYKDAKEPLPAIARALNVDGVVEGTVVRSGPRVRITAQLIDARNDRHLWARSYERDLNDVVALQGEVAQAIAEAVVGKLSQQQRARFMSSRPVSAEANQLLLHGFLAASRQTYEGFGDAITYFEQAIAKQPDFAAAYAAMALTYVQFSFVGPKAPQEFMPKAEAAARKALELDDTLPEAHAVMGIILYRYYWKWSEAEREFRRALALGPSYAETHRMFSVLLSASGRMEEALAEAQRAHELDPLSVQGTLELARSFRENGDYERAITEFRKVLEMDPNRPRAHFQLGVTFVEKDDLDDGISELETAVKLSQGNPRFVAYLGYAQAVNGDTHEAHKILKELETVSRQQYVSPFEVALIYAGLNNRETALVWLEKAYTTHDVELYGLARERRAEPLRSDLRFQGLVQRVGPAQ